jgi:Kdo2-lipid IVA lauroyltransferase/acyltransferase
MATSRWKRIKRSLRAALVRGLVHLLTQLPLRATLAVGEGIGRLAWAFSPNLRRVMRANLALAFPERSAAARDVIARDSLVHLGWVGGEMVSFVGRPEAVEQYVEVAPETLALLARLRQHGKGIVMVLGHIGNWELTCRLASTVGVCGVIAKRTWHRSLDTLAERARAANGVTTLWRSDPGTGRDILRLLRREGTLGMLIDQDIQSVQSVFVPFFDRLAATPRGAADLALHFGAGVVVVTCHRRGPKPGDGHCLEVVEVPYDRSAPDLDVEAERLTAACTRLQEEAIRRHPAEWVWMHQRWKTPGPVLAQRGEPGRTATA